MNISPSDRIQCFAHQKDNGCQSSITTAYKTPEIVDFSCTRKVKPVDDKPKGTSVPVIVAPRQRKSSYSMESILQTMKVRDRNEDGKDMDIIKARPFSMIESGGLDTFNFSSPAPDSRLLQLPSFDSGSSNRSIR